MHRDVALLFLRVTTGLMMAIGHGYGKMASLVAGEVDFPDPLGIGSLPSLILTAFAEFICALMVVFGIKTRYAAIPVAIAMLVAAFMIHAQDPWGRKEFALLYAVPFLTLALAGGGRYSFDAWWRRK